MCTQKVALKREGTLKAGCLTSHVVLNRLLTDTTFGSVLQAKRQQTVFVGGHFDTQADTTGSTIFRLCRRLRRRLAVLEVVQKWPWVAKSAMHPTWSGQRCS